MGWVSFTENDRPGPCWSAAGPAACHVSLPRACACLTASCNMRCIHSPALRRRGRSWPGPAMLPRQGQFLAPFFTNSQTCVSHFSGPIESLAKGLGTKDTRSGDSRTRFRRMLERGALRRLLAPIFPRGNPLGAQLIRPRKISPRWLTRQAVRHLLHEVERRSAPPGERKQGNVGQNRIARKGECVHPAEGGRQRFPH